MTVLLSLREAAARLGLKYDNFYDAARAGDLPITWSGTRRFIDEADLDKCRQGLAARSARGWHARRKKGSL